MKYKYFRYFIILNYIFVFCISPLKVYATSEFSSASFLQQLPFQTKIYKTKKNDTIEAIAKRYNIVVSGLKILNYKKTLFFNSNQKLSENMFLVVPRVPLTKQQSKKFTQEVIRYLELKNKENKKDATSYKVANILKTSHNLGDIKDSVKDSLKNKVIFKATQSMNDWVNQYATANFKLNFNDAFHFADSSLDILFPFYDVQNNLSFFQGSFAHSKDRMRLNLGLGHRYFIASSMIGLNGFFDYDLTGNHSRLGIGGEYWRDYLHFGANGYFALSDWRGSSLIEQTSEKGQILYSERPANGYDLSMQAYLPMHPQLGFDFDFEQYFGDEVAYFDNSKRSKDPYAIKVGLSYTPVPLVRFNAAYQKSKVDQGLRFGMDLTYRLGVSFDKQIKFDQVDYLRRLQGSRYDLVKRNNDIVLDYKENSPVIRFKKLVITVGSSRKLFDEVIVPTGWEIGEWQKDENVQLNENCNRIDSLKECKITIMPDNKKALENSLSSRIVLTLTHTKTLQTRKYETLFTERETEINQSFSKLELSPQDPSLKNKMLVSLTLKSYDEKILNDLEGRLKADLMLPSGVSEKKEFKLSNSASAVYTFDYTPPLEGLYTVKPYVETLNGQIDLNDLKQNFHVTSKDIDQDLSSLTVSQPELVTTGIFEQDKNKTVELTLKALDKNNQPIKDLEKDYKLNVFYNDKKTAEQISLTAKGDGIYTASFSAVKDQNYRLSGKYKFTLFGFNLLYEKIFTTVNLNSDGLALDSNDSYIRFSGNTVILNDQGGKDMNFSYSVKTKNGLLAEKNRIRIDIVDIHNQSVSDVARITSLNENNGVYTDVLTALKEGHYKIRLSYKDNNNVDQLIGVQDLYFINAIPSSNSKIIIDQKTLAINNSANYYTNANITFEAYDEYNRIIDYSSLMANDDYKNSVKTKLTIHGRTVSPLYSFEYKNSNKFFLTLNSDFYKDQGLLGSYNLVIHYKDQEINNLVKTITVSPNYSVPTKINIIQRDDTFDLKDKQKSDIVVQYNVDGFLQDDIGDRLNYRAFKDGEDLGNGTLSAIYKKDKHTISFSPREEGSYEIRAYYKTYDFLSGTVGEDKEIPESVKIEVQDTREKVLDENETTLAVENSEDLVASGDLREDQYKKSKLILVAKTTGSSGSTQPMLGLENSMKIAVFDNLLNQELERLDLKPTTKDGIYSAEFGLIKDNRYSPSKAYDFYLADENTIYKKVNAFLNVNTDKAFIDPDQIQFDISRDVVMLSSKGGYASEYSFSAKLKSGDALSEDRLKVILQNLEGTDVTSKMKVTLKSNVNNVFVYNFSALDTNHYKLVLKYLDVYGNYQEISSKNVYFIDGTPSQEYSKLSSERTSLAPDNNGGYFTTSLLTLQLYDEYNHPLNYDQLTSDISYKTNFKLKTNLPASERPSFTYVKDNQFTYLFDASKNEFSAQKTPVSFKILYKDAEIENFSSSLTVDYAYTAPIKAIPNGGFENMGFDVGAQNTYTVENGSLLYKNWLYNDVNRRLKFTLYKDQELKSPVNINEYSVTSNDNINYHFTVTPSVRGISTYWLRVSYLTYDLQKPNIDVASYKISVDYKIDYSKTRIKVENNDLIAKGLSDDYTKASSVSFSFYDTLGRAYEMSQAFHLVFKNKINEDKVALDTKMFQRTYAINLVQNNQYIPEGDYTAFVTIGSDPEYNVPGSEIHVNLDNTQIDKSSIVFSTPNKMFTQANKGKSFEMGISAKYQNSEISLPEDQILVKFFDKNQNDAETPVAMRVSEIDSASGTAQISAFVEGNYTIKFIHKDIFGNEEELAEEITQVIPIIPEEWDLDATLIDSNSDIVKTTLTLKDKYGAPIDYESLQNAPYAYESMKPQYKIFPKNHYNDANLVRYFNPTYLKAGVYQDSIPKSDFVVTPDTKEYTIEIYDAPRNQGGKWRDEASITMK